MNFGFDTLKESIAITVYNKERTINYLAPLFAAAGPEDAQKLLKSYRGVVFPEDKYDDAKYLQHAKDMFEKLRKVNLSVIPEDTKPM